MSQFVVADGMSKSINKHTRHENCAKSAKDKSIILPPTNPEAEVFFNSVDLEISQHEQRDTAHYYVKMNYSLIVINTVTETRRFFLSAIPMYSRNRL